MRKTLLFTCAAIMMGSTPARADEKGREASLVTGKVKAVDPAAATISLEDRKKDGGEVIQGKTYKLAPDAKVFSNEQPIPLREIKAGSIVAIRLSEDQTVALKVFVNPGREGAREGDKGRRERALIGELSKINGATLTITRRTDGGDRTDEFTLSKDAKILFETDDDEKAPGEGGKERLIPKTKNITLADLKTGQRVAVTAGEDRQASKVVVLRTRKGKEEKRLRALGGEVTKVDGKIITVTRRGDDGETSNALTLAEAVRIVVETDEVEQVTGEDGTVRNRPKQKAGTAADIKVGKHVNVQVGEDGKAVKVLVFRAKKTEKD